MEALVGADRDGPRRVEEEIVLAGRQWLFHQFQARFGTRRHVRRERRGVPCLVGVGDKPRLRRRAAHCCHPLGVSLTTELELEQRRTPAIPRKP